jgi:integrase
VALTDTAIRNSKPATQPYKLWDGGGLHLLINPNGSRLWRLKYRIAGREKLLSIGRYPTVSLKAARESREQAKGLLAGGGDPSEAKKSDRRAAETSASNTFRAIADEYVAKIRREGRAEATITKAEWLLGFANEKLGFRPIRDITAPEVLGVLRSVERNGRHESAQRLRSVIGRVFRYAVATARAENDPTFALRGALTRPTVTSRAAITDKKAFGALLRAIDTYPGQPTTRAALKLMALLFPRPGELRFAHWAEFDLDQGVWTIPAARTKMRRAHRVPLPSQAVEILSDLHAITGAGALVLPSLQSPNRPMSENTLNAALRRLGYGKDEATAHGFRATFSTIANESGRWHPDAIERALAHIEASSVRKAYARGEHWDERVRMGIWWASLLDELTAGQ